jgi:hypothetical protein
MPFTLAHAAAALPLAKIRALPLPALVVGTMIPDLPMFLRAGPSYATTHAPMTAIPVGVPLGLIALLLFQSAKAPAIALFPASVRTRLARHARPRWLRVDGDTAVQAAALALGIVTHVVWDAFTHENGWGTSFAGLATPWLQVGTFSLPGYKVLQHLSSLVGLALIGECSFHWTRRQPVGSDSELGFSRVARAGLLALLLAGVPAACSVYAWQLRSGEDRFLEEFMYELVTRTIALEVVIVLAARALLRPSAGLA